MNPAVEEPPDEVDVALRLLDGDQACLVDLIRLTAPIEEAIRGRFPSVAADAEDIVAEAVRRLWKSRDNFDPDRPLRPYLYRIAERVALEHVEGRLAKNSPEATFRLGSVSATVFVQETGADQRTFRTVSLQRSYREGDQTKYSGSFTAADLPTAIRTLQLAQQHVEQQDILPAE